MPIGEIVGPAEAESTTAGPIPIVPCGSLCGYELWGGGSNAKPYRLV